MNKKITDGLIEIMLSIALTGGVFMLAGNAHSKPETPVMLGACKTGQAAAVARCAVEYENKWYDTGAITYMRSEHLKDIPLCDRVGEAAFLACNHYGKE